MATEEYQVGYETGYQDGWNAAQKPFVGLTDDDVRPLCKESWVFESVKQWAEIIEAKLKEKNGGAA